MRYRNKTELIASIPKAINGRNVNSVQIMYKTFLPYAKVKQYLSISIAAGHYKKDMEETIELHWNEVFRLGQ